MHLRGYVLTCERVSQFCLNEEKKGKKEINSIEYITMCLCACIAYTGCHDIPTDTVPFLKISMHVRANWYGFDF